MEKNMDFNYCSNVPILLYQVDTILTNFTHKVWSKKNWDSHFLSLLHKLSYLFYILSTYVQVPFEFFAASELLSELLAPNSKRNCIVFLYSSWDMACSNMRVQFFSDQTLALLHINATSIAPLSLLCEHFLLFEKKITALLKSQNFFDCYQKTVYLKKTFSSTANLTNLHA